MRERSGHEDVKEVCKMDSGSSDCFVWIVRRYSARGPSGCCPQHREGEESDGANVPSARCAAGRCEKNEQEGCQETGGDCRIAGRARETRPFLCGRSESPRCAGDRV